MENTHCNFDGEKVIVSSNLRIIVSFLQEIEKEIKTVLNYDKQLDLIRKQHLETIELLSVLGKKLKDNSIDFKFTLSEPPDTFAEKIKIERPTRAEMIMLFANLEVLFCLTLAYENKIVDKVEIIKKAMNQKLIIDFLDRFCLNKENKWCQKYPERFHHISSDDLRKLRNSLTHFFSVDSLGISYSKFDEKSRKLEIDTSFKIKIITPEDLYEIINGAVFLLINKWSIDCQSSFDSKTNDFMERILSVKSIIEKHGARIILSKDIV